MKVPSLIVIDPQKFKDFEDVNLYFMSATGLISNFCQQLFYRAEEQTSKIFLCKLNSMVEVSYNAVLHQYKENITRIQLLFYCFHWCHIQQGCQTNFQRGETNEGKKGKICFSFSHRHHNSFHQREIFENTSP